MDVIPKETLQWAQRRFARKIAAAVIQAMAETDCNFTQMAARIGRTEKEITGWIAKLMDGDGSGTMLDHVSDMLLAMGCELDWHIVKAVEIPFRKQEAA